MIISAGHRPTPCCDNGTIEARLKVYIDSYMMQSGEQNRISSIKACSGHNLGTKKGAVRSPFTFAFVHTALRDYPIL
jgi:hypothetical protein